MAFSFSCCVSWLLLVAAGVVVNQVDCFQYSNILLRQHLHNSPHHQRSTTTIAFSNHHHLQQQRPQRKSSSYSSTLFYGSNGNGEDEQNSKQENQKQESKRKPSKDYELEETLLRVHLSPRINVDIDIALEKVSKYTTSFPFAAVLPVQPLHYLPTDDGGVNVKFLRKKTPEKGSIDGGIRFFIGKERDGIEIVAKRNSEGQTIPKIFAERLIIQAYAKGISGDEIFKTNLPPIEYVTLDSIFHKWME